MKKTILLMMLLLLICEILNAQVLTDIKFSWDQNKESDLMGYWVHYVSQDSCEKDSIPSMTNSLTVDVNIFEIDVLYRITITAFDSSGNISEHSDGINLFIHKPAIRDTIPPDKIKNEKYEELYKIK